jgi:hypothetical protein
LLPPYFAFARFDDPWLPVNKTLFDSMCELADGLPVYLPVAFDHSLLEDPRAVEQICEIVSDAGAEGCAVWPVGLDEMNASAQELAAMGRLLQMLPHPSVLLYAGYFSTLLCAENGSSFSSGPCFYEKRDIVIAPRLEFRPRCRYYLRDLHLRVNPLSAVAF